MLKKILITGIILFILGMAGYSIINKPYQEIAVGTDTVLVAGLSTYTLSGSGISSTATSIGLTKLTIPQNDYPIQDSDLSATFYITIEPGNTSRQEFASCTTVGTNSGGTVSLSGCLRGLSPISPYTASTTLAFSHSGGSKMIFSNSPQLYNDATFKGNDETITGAWLIGTPSASTQIANKSYVDGVAIAGSATSTEALGGIWELGTQIEMASSTATNWTNQPRGVQSKYGTSTPSGSSYSALYFPVAQNDGYLSQLWTRLSDAYTWTGAHIFSSTVNITGLFTTTATSTMATTTIDKLTVTEDITATGGTSAFGTVTSSTFTNSGTASTTTMIISGTQTGGNMSSTASSTAYSVSSSATTYTGSIPTSANFGIGSYDIDVSGAFSSGTFIIMRTGLTSVEISHKDGTVATYTMAWSGANFSVTETTDNSSAISGTVYWYR